MTVIWFPCHLQPISVFNFGKWEVRPGLKAGPILASEKAVWDSVAVGPFKESFGPNFLVQIDKELFEKALIDRLREQGHDIDKWLKKIPPEFRDNLPWMPDDLFRWVIISMSLSHAGHLASDKRALGFDFFIKNHSSKKRILPLSQLETSSLGKFQLTGLTFRRLFRSGLNQYAA
jgi:hypothetical protein